MNKTSLLLFLLFSGLTGEKVFADVVLFKSGFSQIAGNVTGNAREISVMTFDGVRPIPIDRVFSIRFGPPEADPAASPQFAAGSAETLPPGAARPITLPAGTPITVRTIDEVDSKTGDTQREYAASVDEPVVMNQVTVVPAKVNAVLKIGQIEQAGRLRGSTSLSLRLVSMTIDGRKFVLETGDVVSTSNGKGKATIRDGAIGAAAGCGIGAATAGAVGCEVGGAVGGAIGVGTSVLLGKDVRIDPEMRLTFKLAQPVTIWVPAPPSTVPLPASMDSPLSAALNRGEAHMKANELAEALKEYQAALGINPRSSLAHYQAGMVFFQQRNLDAAVNEFSEAFNGDLDPKWVVVWIRIRLGQIFDQMGQRDRAINEYIQAVQTGDNTYAAQSFATGYLRTPCRADVCPDTLTLRNASSVAGNWLSVDDDKIQFLTDDKLQTYSKSDVLVVTFGSVAAAPAAPAAPPSPVAGTVASTSPPPARAQTPQVVYGPEPEWVGAVYFRDEAGKFIPLERSTGASVSPPLWAPYSYTLQLYRIEGPSSSVRFKSSQKMLFVVRLANGVDPRVFQLYTLASKKGARAPKIDSKTKTWVTARFDITRVGASSYGLVPEAALPPGEYGFSPKGSNDVYCFGVDP